MKYSILLKNCYLLWTILTVRRFAILQRKLYVSNTKRLVCYTSLFTLNILPGVRWEAFALQIFEFIFIYSNLLL